MVRGSAKLSVSVDELPGDRLGVSLLLPESVTGHSGKPVNLVGFFQTGTRDELLLEVGRTVVALARGERLP